MRRPPWYLKQIRERLSIADYAGRRMTFDRRKSRPSAGDYWAPCPFHPEKSASFHVLDAKGAFKCFGCGEGGDIFKLCQKLEGLDFHEAVDRLASEAGMPAYEADPVQQKAMDARDVRLRLVARADAMFRRALKGPEGAPARSYLEGRGLGPDAWEHFGIGYAPDQWTWLIDALASDGVSRADAIAAGLAREGGRSGAIDAFRNRVMFPIADTQGRTIAFGGRLISADPNAPKYLNSSDSDIFHKGQTLYRLKQAREIASRAKAQSIVVAEGYLDVAAFERAGVGAVAPLGTALTEEQLLLLWKSGVTPLLCFDGDDAGRKAADRALDVALPHLAPERTLRLVFLQSGMDPDDVYRRAGPDALKALLAAPTPAVDALFDRERRRRPLDTPEARADFKARLAQVAARITHADTRREYERALRDMSFEAMRRAPPPPSAGRTQRRDPRRPIEAPLTPELKQLTHAEAVAPTSRTPEDLLRFTVDHGYVLDRGAELLAQAPFPDPDLDRIRHALLDLWAQSRRVDRALLNAHLLTLGLDTIAERVLAWPSQPPPKQGARGTGAAPAPAAPPPAEELPSGEERQAVEAEWRAFLTQATAASVLDAEIKATSAADLDTDDQAFEAGWRARRERHTIDQEALRRGRGPETGAGLAGEIP